MKKLSIIKICILLSFNSFAQKGNNRLIAEYEDTLKIIAHKIMNAETEEERKIANKENEARKMWHFAILVRLCLVCIHLDISST